jgi:hypothetical protein
MRAKPARIPRIIHHERSPDPIFEITRPRKCDGKRTNSEPNGALRVMRSGGAFYWNGHVEHPTPRERRGAEQILWEFDRAIPIKSRTRHGNNCVAIAVTHAAMIAILRVMVTQRSKSSQSIALKKIPPMKQIAEICRRTSSGDIEGSLSHHSGRAEVLRIFVRKSWSNIYGQQTQQLMNDSRSACDHDRAL